MTTAAPPFTSATPSMTSGPLPTLTDPSDVAFRGLDVLVLESCHSTWIFDPRRLEFCRILKGVEVASRSVVTKWRPYWQVQLDPEAEGFTVYLNAAGTRLIRSWRHATNCTQCGESDTPELSLQDVHRILHQ
jgi:hypothetical protein